MDWIYPIWWNSFWPPVILLAVIDLSFRLPLVMTSDNVEYYDWFNLLKIWSMCFQHSLLPPWLSTLKEHITSLLRSSQLWSVFCWWKLRFLWADLVQFYSDGVYWSNGCCEIQERWRRNEWYDVILFYIKISVKGSILMQSSPI